MSRFLALALTIIAIAPACQRETDLRVRVISYVENTEQKARSFTYSAAQGDQTHVVSGEVEDAFRYRAVLTEAGAEVAQYVVDDDSLAVKITDVTKFPTVTGTVAPENVAVANALKEGKWVVDPSGAPDIYRSTDVFNTGADHMHDAISVLRYVKASINEAVAVAQWSEDDLDPAYRPAEGALPPPDEDSGERRFDLVRVAIPRPNLAQSGISVPARASMFRKMAIYVRGNLVVKVVEEIDIENHKDFIEARRTNRKAMLELLETIKSGVGVEGVLIPRQMTVSFASIGKEVQVRQPPEAVTSSLQILQSEQEQEVEYEPPASEATPSPSP